jgi:hypothetical protein
MKKMRADLKEAFKLVLTREISSLGYNMNSDTVFATEVSRSVLGCIGYITSVTGVRPFVGVQFEQVEKIFEEIIQPLRVVAKSTPRYWPTLSRDINQLKQDHSADPNFRLREGDYLQIEIDSIPHICDQILADIRRFGLEYIESNSVLANAAETMADGRGGGIGSIAYRLPIIYWILGRKSEAESYMANIAAKRYPIGDYEQYADLLSFRINSEAPPSSS